VTATMKQDCGFFQGTGEWRPQLSKQLLHRNHKYNHKG
jgi:hypothetical protein